QPQETIDEATAEPLPEVRNEPTVEEKVVADVSPEVKEQPGFSQAEEPTPESKEPSSELDIDAMLLSCFEEAQTAPQSEEHSDEMSQFDAPPAPDQLHLSAF
ncbi:MAG: hypothetical protein Q4E62_06915, partial [Sutterellaceae bacterium]|nr:hypothetical protein [Sutterellaceae bacterium]